MLLAHVFMHFFVYFLKGENGKPANTHSTSTYAFDAPALKQPILTVETQSIIIVNFLANLVTDNIRQICVCE